MLLCESQKRREMQPVLWLRLVGRWAILLLSSLLSKLQEIMRVLILWVISAGPIPSHIAFIMDGNRRFADRLHVDRRIGHSHGYDALLRILKDCFDLHVKTVTLFAFSIDNFHRPPDEVSALMDLMQTKLENLVEKKGLASEYGIRVRILGDLSLLPHGARMAAEKAMAVTSQNSSAVLNLCISYTSTHEIVQSIQRTRDNVLAVLSGDDGSQGSVMHNCKKSDMHIQNGNGHADWSYMARRDCASDCGHIEMDGSGERSLHYTCNGDYVCSNGSHSERDDGVVDGNCSCVNVCHCMQVAHGGYDQCIDCGYASRCNGWDFDQLVDVKGVCENGVFMICNEGANNSKPDASSTEISVAHSRNNIRSSQVSVCKVAQSKGLRNRTFKKSLFQDPHAMLICERNSNQSQQATSTVMDYGYATQAQTTLGNGGSLTHELACGSFNEGCESMDCCYTCKSRSFKQCLSGLSNSDSSSKLQHQQYQLGSTDSSANGATRKADDIMRGSCVNGAIRNSGNIMREGFLSNCNCGKHCYLNDRIFKLVKDCISEEQIEKHLYTEPCPPPDLLIRTSGETRLSNFLLWQTSCSHLAFCKVLWPEFSFWHLFFIILEYQRAFPSLLRKRHNCNIAWRKNQ